MKRIFSFIIPMKNRAENEVHRMKIVKDLFRKFNPLVSLAEEECDNFYYLDVLKAEKIIDFLIKYFSYFTPQILNEKMIQRAFRESTNIVFYIFAEVLKQIKAK